MKLSSKKQTILTILVGFACVVLLFTAGLFAVKQFAITFQLTTSTDIVCKIEIATIDNDATLLSTDFGIMFDNTASSKKGNETLTGGISRSINNGIMTFTGGPFANISTSKTIYIRITNSTPTDTTASNHFLNATLTRNNSISYSILTEYSKIQCLSNDSTENANVNIMSFNFNNYYYQTGTTAVSVPLKLQLSLSASSTEPYKVTYGDIENGLENVASSNVSTQIISGENYTTRLFSQNGNPVSITSITTNGTRIFERAYFTINSLTNGIYSSQPDYATKTFTYNPITGELTIPSTAITGNLVITATTKQKNVTLSSNLSHSTKIEYGNITTPINYAGIISSVVSSESNLEFNVITNSNFVIKVGGTQLPANSYTIMTQFESLNITDSNGKNVTKVVIPSSLISGNITIEDIVPVEP